MSEVNLAGLCKGSTADSDSVCEGSNPSPAAKDINTFMVEVLYYESVDFFRKENNIGAGSGKQTLSNKEKCMMLIDSFDEGQLLNIAAMLQAARDAVDEALDDSFCNRLYEEYLNDPEKNESASIQDLATELGISL